MKQFFPKNFHHFSPTTSFWPPKQHFLSILDKFWQISAFYSTVTSKLPPYHKGDCLYNTQEVILKQFFPKIFHHFGPMTSFWPPKNSTFWAFLTIFCIFQAFTQLWHGNYPHQTMVEIVHNTQEIISKHHFGPMTYFLSILSKLFKISAFYSTIKWNTPQTHGVDCSKHPGDYFETNFCQNFVTILAIWRRLDFQNCT